MLGAHDSEVATIECGDLGGIESLGGGDNGGVNGAESDVPVAVDELGDPEPIGGLDGLAAEVAGRQIPEEPDLSIRAEAAGDQVGDLGDDERRYDERSGV